MDYLYIIYPQYITPNIYDVKPHHQGTPRGPSWTLTRFDLMSFLKEMPNAEVRDIGP